MTGTDDEFKWLLWTFPEHNAVMTDEFIAEGFRVRLMGNMLGLSFEASGHPSAAVAKALAERYVRALGKHLAMPVYLISEQEFLERTTPPFGGTTLGATILTASRGTWREDRDRRARAVREARKELSCADQTLQQCYDYLEDAREEDQRPGGKPWDPVYKAMEVLKERFGSGAEAVKALGKVFEQTKMTANEKRHHKKKGQPRSTTPERSSVELARETIRAYERYLLKLS
jgi:hypothetical protein